MRLSSKSLILTGLIMLIKGLAFASEVQDCINHGGGDPNKEYPGSGGSTYQQVCCRMYGPCS
jgi:hypothetical protein